MQRRPTPSTRVRFSRGASSRPPRSPPLSRCATPRTARAIASARTSSSAASASFLAAAPRALTTRSRRAHSRHRAPTFPPQRSPAVLDRLLPHRALPRAPPRLRPPRRDRRGRVRAHPRPHVERVRARARDESNQRVGGERRTPGVSLLFLQRVPLPPRGRAICHRALRRERGETFRAARGQERAFCSRGRELERGAAPSNDQSSQRLFPRARSSAHHDANIPTLSSCVFGVVGIGDGAANPAGRGGGGARGGRRRRRAPDRRVEIKIQIAIRRVVVVVVVVPRATLGRCSA